MRVTSPGADRQRIAVGIEYELVVARVVEILVRIRIDADEALHALRARGDRFAVPGNLQASELEVTVRPILDVQFPARAMRGTSGFR